MIEDQSFKAKISAVEIELMALEMTNLRVLSKISAGEAPGAESSLLKIKGTEVQQSITALLMEAVGYYAFPYDKVTMTQGWQEEPIGHEQAAMLAPHYFDWRKSSIYGGSNEIQKHHGESRTRPLEIINEFGIIRRNGHVARRIK